MSFSYNTWKTSWKTSWLNSWGKGSSQDTHDGADGYIEDTNLDERYRKHREAQALLRQQIRYALEGPLPQLAPQLEAVAQPQVEDSEYRPLWERVDLEKVQALADVVDAMEKAYEKYLEDERDDEETILLMM